MIDYISENLWQLWAVVAVIGLILELMSGDFFIICFALGALCSAFVATFAGFYAQLAVFIIVSLLAIWQVRPFALRYLHKGDQNYVDNADAVVGQRGTVTTEIPANGTGRVKAANEDWKATAADGSPIPKGAVVRIVERRSITLIVEMINN